MIDLPAVLIALVVMGVLIAGIKLSSRVNQVVVAIKLAVVAAVILFGVSQISADNYSPFVPPSQPAPETAGSFADVPLISSLMGYDPAVFGIAGVFAGAAIVFFAFIGFDVVATTAEEAHEPPAGHAARHPRLAGHRDGPLHGRQPGGHRHAELHRHRPRGRRTRWRRPSTPSAWSGWAA